MAPSQQQQPQPPSLKQALAVAVLLKKRAQAAVVQVTERCTQLEEEAERLRAAAAVPPALPPPLPLLAQLVAPPASALGPPAPTAPAPATPSTPDPDSLAFQLDSLRLWHQAGALLAPADPALWQALAAAQRYSLLKELADGPAGGLPAAAALERTPVGALLELAGDILQTHASAEQAVAAGGSAEQERPEQAFGAPCPPISPQAHAPMLAAAVVCAVLLCSLPGQAVVEACYAALQQFCSLTLQLAAAAPPPPPPPSGAAAAGSAPHHHQQQQQQAADASAAHVAVVAQPAGVPAIDLSQPSCQVAQQVLGLVAGSPNAGMVLLSCAAPCTRNCMNALVAAVLGEPPPLPMQAGSLGGGSLPGGGPSASAAEEAAAREEGCLLRTFAVLSQQLSAGLHQLPRWVQATRLHDEAFLQELASAVLSARDAAQLISLSHPAAARQMQRVAAQMIGALQVLAASPDGDVEQERDL